jgi:hypothetical protein
VDTSYEVAVTDTGSTGEIPPPSRTVRAQLTTDVVDCPDGGHDTDASPPACASPVRVVAAVPAQSTPVSGALPDYVGNYGGNVYVIAQGQVTLTPDCTRLLLAGDAAGTARLRSI